MQICKSNAWVKENATLDTFIVTPCGLPVPAVKGGAVLTLVESIIKQNEKQARMHLTVLGVYDEEAVATAEKYPNTNFIFLKIPKWVRNLDYITNKILSSTETTRKFCGKEYARKLFVVHKVKNFLKKQTYDRVVFQNAGYLLKVVLDKRVSKKYRGKLYYHLHNDIPNNVSISAVKQCKLLLISKYLINHIDDVCNEDMSKQCMIVKNGFDCEKFAQNLSENDAILIKEKLEIPKASKVVLFAGRIIQEKGINELVEAFSKINRKDVVLLVVGSHNFGTGQTSVFQEKMKVKFSQLGERVRFTGFIPYTDIWKYYKLADVAALPSMWEEPAGLTMIEACAAGIPLITTQTGGIPEYVPHNEVLLLDKDENIIDSLKSAIENVLDNPVEWRERALRAQSYVKDKYSEEKYYNNFVESIEEPFVK